MKTGDVRDGPIRPFTRRQREIAAQIHLGRSYAEIGAELGISQHTVRAHVRLMGDLFPQLIDLPPRWRVYTWLEYQKWLDLNAGF